MFGRRLRYLRYGLAIIGLAGVVFLPPYVPLVCMFLLSVRFRAYEVLVIGFMMDLLWLPTASYGELPLYTFLGIAVVWGLEPLRMQFLR